MSDLILGLIVVGVTIIINAVFISNRFNRSYKMQLINGLRSMPPELKYEILDDKQISVSSIESNKIINENDLISEYTLEGFAYLYLNILSNQTNNTLLKRTVNYLYTSTKVLSVIFSIALFMELFGGDTGLVIILTVTIVVLTLFLLIFCKIYFPTYKKYLDEHPFNEPDTFNIYLSLYWYLPIFIPNISLGFINHIKWLFSKGER